MMQKATPMPPATPAFPLFSVGIFSKPSSLSRPATRDGSVDPLHPHPPPHAAPPPIPSARDARKPSFSRKPSQSGAAARRRGSSVGSSAAASSAVVTDAAAPPALPDYALPAAARAKGQQRRARELGSLDDPLRSPVSPMSGGGGGGFFFATASTAAAAGAATGPGAGGPPTASAGVSSVSAPGAAAWQHGEASAIHQQITEVAGKRISTLDYLRKAHEGRVYWFNTYLFERADLARMPCFDPRKLARKATNYLLLGLSIPTINDLYSSTPIEFLRCLNSLLSEFDSFQQLHGDSSASLARARLPTMFRRPGSKARRSTSSATDVHLDESHALPPAAGTPSVMNFAASESDLLPGEEYTYLLTPALPFEPDFFETFATLCDVLIDCYSRFLALIPTPRECSAPVAEMFTKADARLRKIIVQGVVKEFEEHSRAHIRAEVASIGKVVLGGLM
ncbi:uncharacterized protein UV8b_07654 [Ustilaginoidea virens]|uniref:Uncharacterized protein n=2 Tax=Ustilaginoidea virens TaxID=1159556 RepID=A0A8E5HXN9_USTVR|nr:uncharacterized protein UV8b_07654 [Ustilaginoidea virens]QUC23413.1 hypothetical protein UV8b_07654 [Ustilaginoidea virens]